MELPVHQFPPIQLQGPREGKVKWVSFGVSRKAQPDMQGNQSPAVAKSFLVLLAGGAEERHAMPAALCCGASARSGVTEEFAEHPPPCTVVITCGGDDSVCTYRWIY